MEDDIRKRIGKKIRELRGRRNQEAIAGQVPCSRKHLIDMEAGRVDIGVVMLEKIATAFDTNIVKFFE